MTAVAEAGTPSADLVTKDHLDRELRSLRAELKAEMAAIRWQVIAGIALLLLAHFGAVWSLIRG